MTMTITESGLRVRTPTLDDLEAVYALANAYDTSIYGAPDFTREDIATGWRDIDFNLAHDAWIVESLERRVVGYAEVWNARLVQFRTMVFTHPDFPRDAIETELLRRAEQRVQERIPEALPHARVSLRHWCPVADPARRGVFERAGFAPVRRFWRMRIDMDTPPLAPVWPEGITLRTMRPGEEPAVHAALDEAFEDHWGHLPMPFEAWRTFFLERADFDATLCFLAMDGDQFAGFSLCRPDQGMGWVDDVAVRRPWRRRGLALALLLHSFGEFYRRGERAAGLDVDAQSLTGATHLYEKAGMRPIREWEVFEKEMRSGIELSTQTLE